MVGEAVGAVKSGAGGGNVAGTSRHHGKQRGVAQKVAVVQGAAGATGSGSESSGES